MKKIRLALLSGGVSTEREVSLNSGNQVFAALDKEKYDIKRYDPKFDLAKLVTDAPDIDAALIILHGPFGEDGTVQGLLDLLNIPYQGAGVLGSAVAMNKLMAKRLYRQAGIPTPDYISISTHTPDPDPQRLKAIGLPIVVKPVCAGSSVGMSIVSDEKDLPAAIENGFQNDDTLILEQYIKGTELTCGVLGNQDPEALPVIEIVPGEGHDFFDYQAKYVAGETHEICPARIDEQTTQRVYQLAVEAHRTLFLKGYSRTDMMLKDGQLYVLETNTIPGMTATSLFPQSAAKAGIEFGDLMDKLIELAIEENKRTNVRRAQ
ncbi:D-alanine--D-alanine ligase [uncultured Desulfobacter sp.]|uniref:D-alanine--D-alanine ligase family protein n=1 Tax=uncultured Desulfobacter sp. TaxID=240139 RepID=UPI002AAB3F6B|nr:D-alanine--D-alanine ligase [uncultured Desulfobacter sp.]